jgi:hypothetical protein
MLLGLLIGGVRLSKACQQVRRRDEMAPRGWTWAPNPKKALEGGISKDERKRVEAKANELIERVLKPKCVYPLPKHPKYNWCVDIFVRWHQSYLYFIERLYCPFENRLSEYFELKQVRLQCLKNGNFSVFYMRHTGEWWPLEKNVSLSSALRAVANAGVWFPPMTA